MDTKGREKQGVNHAILRFFKAYILYLYFISFNHIWINYITNSFSIEKQAKEKINNMKKANLLEMRFMNGF